MNLKEIFDKASADSAELGGDTEINYLCGLQAVHEAGKQNPYDEVLPVDSQTPGSIAKVGDLAMLVRRLARVIRKYNHHHPVMVQALDYLDRHNLRSSPLKQ